MTIRLDLSIGPVQGFVAQSRRTRDLWGSSYLLSFLAAHAMHGAEKAGGRIIRPVPAGDRLYQWVTGRREGPPPGIGTLPNHFVVEVDGDPKSVAGAGIDALETAWKRVCEAVWERFAEHACSAGDGTQHIWNRQTCGFWEVIWTAGSGRTGHAAGALLARRKHWRSHRLPEEPGDKCTVMPDLQELSGYVRAESRESKESQDRFWRRVRKRTGDLELRDNERLCAVALVKRLFPKVAKEAVGWEMNTVHWPSTVYVAAVPWIRRVVDAPQQVKQQGEEYAKALSKDAKGVPIVAERHPQFAGLDGPEAGDFPKLDANYLHDAWVKNERQCPLAEDATDETRERLSRQLKAIYDAKDQAGEKLGPPSSFYALLLADGDRLGRLVSKQGGGRVGRSLANFTEKVQKIVREHDGVTVYAGGDDVLAILPVPGALSCAASLSCGYQSAFEEEFGESVPGATLSASVVFAQVRFPLRSVLETAHRLLDQVAKDGNGRNSLAAGVLKPGGLNCQWVTTWKRTGPSGDLPSAVELLYRLTESLKANATMDPGLSSALIYRLRETLATLCGWDRWEPGAWNVLPTGLDLRAFSRAEVLRSLSLRTLGLRMEADAEARVDEVSGLVWELLIRSRADNDTAEPVKTDEVGVDSLLLARFLADPGTEEGDR